MPRITDRLVKSLEPPERANRVTYDSELKGFGVRVTARRSKAFVLNYRAAGVERRTTIGAYPDWSVAAAREEAKRLKREVDQGHDPVAERREERASPTVRDLAERYQEERLPAKRPRTQKEDKAMLRDVILPRLGNLKVARVRHRDVEALHRRLKATPYRANRVRSLLSSMFNEAIRWEWTDANPVKGVRKYPEEPRHRYLTPDELRRLAAVLDELEDQEQANFFRLLVLTGARKGEVMSARWRDFDLEAGVWTKPSSHTKQKRLHRTPLSAPTVALLREMKSRATGEFLFPGKVPGQPVAEVRRWWDQIRQRAGVPDARIHDLRHTYASVLASAGLSLPVIGALLGHTQPSTTARYAHLRDDPLREATEQVGRAFLAAGDDDAD